MGEQTQIPEGKYKIIYADPPWSYKQQGGPNGKRGMANAHYPTMSVDEIASLPVRRLCGGGARCLLYVGDVSEHSSSFACYGGMGI